MVILGRPVSDNLDRMLTATEAACAACGTHLGGFEPIPSGKSFASVVPVTLKILLAPEWQERSVAHELAHILMLCDGYPGSRSFTNDKEASSLAGTIDGVANHLEVIRRMRAHGFDDDFSPVEANIEKWLYETPPLRNAPEPYRTNFMACYYAYTVHRSAPNRHRYFSGLFQKYAKPAKRLGERLVQIVTDHAECKTAADSTLCLRQLIGTLRYQDRIILTNGLTGTDLP